MDNIEESKRLFDINEILNNIFLTLKNLIERKEVKLIFQVSKHIPRELRGEYQAFENFLTTLLSYILEHTTQDELLLCLDAPQDFLYEECISFTLKEVGIEKELLEQFTQSHLQPLAESLHTTIKIETDKTLTFDIPFIIGELGFRRHYRLPSILMLDKKVLLLIESRKITQSVSVMFEYFNYEVERGLEAFEKGKIDFLKYDLVLIESNLQTEAFLNQVKQTKSRVKYVTLCEDEEDKGVIEKHLCLPITPKKVFELILDIFEHHLSDESFVVAEKEIMDKFE